ncbi:MAG: hypothetical protein J5886_05805 [Bacteroidales bacterium]|nr:hypothetical protein [Bacteroidales bacterium]
MNDNDLNILLRANRPVVKENPAFILKARQRVNAVEGIKNEVDRQRKHGLIALSVTLLIGLAAGILIAVFLLLAPIDSIRALIGEWKLYIEVAVSIIFTLIAIYLGNGISVFVRTIPVTSLYLRETGSRVP